MQCVIAAGGRGTRLYPLTEEVPKPMVLVNGVPFLHWLIEKLCSQKITRFLILTGYRSSLIQDYFGDGSALECSITYSHEESPLGSGGALWAARQFLEDQFLYINGDDYPAMDYAAFIDAFQQKNSLAMVAICKDASGRLAIDEANYTVKRFTPSSFLPFLDCGTKIFQKHILNLVSPQTPFNLEEALWPVLIAKEQLAVFHLASRPQRIDTVERLHECENWFLTQKIAPPSPLISNQ